MTHIAYRHTESEAKPQAWILVGNLPPNTERASLWRLCHRLVRGRIRLYFMHPTISGCGCVAFEDITDSKNAADALNEFALKIDDKIYVLRSRCANVEEIPEDAIIKYSVESNTFGDVVIENVSESSRGGEAQHPKQPLVELKLQAYGRHKINYERAGNTKIGLLHVHFLRADNALRAIRELNNTVIDPVKDKRRITLRWANSSHDEENEDSVVAESSSGTNAANRIEVSSQHEDCYELYFSGLPPSINEETLKKILRKHNITTRSVIIKAGQGNKNFAFISFDELNSCLQTLAKLQTEPDLKRFHAKLSHGCRRTLKNQNLDLAKVKNYFFSLLSALEPEAADDYTKNIFDADEEESEDANENQTDSKADMTTPYVMYLANVPVEMPNDEIERICGSYGQIVKFCPNVAKENAAKYCFVYYKELSQALRAIQALNRRQWYGQPIDAEQCKDLKMYISKIGLRDN